MLGSLFSAIDTRYNFCEKFSLVILAVWLDFLNLIVGTNKLHDFDKEYVSLTTAAMKMGKWNFYSDHSKGC